MNKKTLGYLLSFAGVATAGVVLYINFKNKDKAVEIPVEETLIVDATTQE